MKTFIVSLALVACAAAANEKREKRGFISGLHSLDTLTYGGAYDDAYSSLYGSHSLEYAAPPITASALETHAIAPPVVAAPAISTSTSNIVTVDKVVNSARVVDVPQVVNVRKVVTVPQVVSVNKLVAAPSYSTYGNGLTGYGYGYNAGYSYGSAYGYGSGYSNGWW